MPVLKGERENLWVKYKKAISTEDKTFILERINLLSDEISTLYGQRNACIRIIETHDRVYDEYYKEKNIKEKINKISENQKLRNR